MEREILFRGKRIDNGEWIEGDLLHDYWMGDNTFIPFSIRYKINGIYSFPITVIPETVGQFTGFTDKNGRKIFEGAIVKNGDYTYFIKFCNGAYYAFHCRVKDAEGKPYRWGLISRFGELNIEIEIIGNIHDNPELL